FTLAVSSGQELVTAAPSYLSYALDQPETRVLALVLEAVRQPGQLRDVLASAAGRGIPVVLLTAGSSAGGRAMVAAHSGALAGTDGAWEALTRAYGLHRAFDLAELADTLELFSLQGSRRGRTGPGSVRGIATVHDSGLERAHAADVAEHAGVPFAAISDQTRARLQELLDPGLLPANPLDVWGTGADTRELFGECLVTLARDESVDAVALAVDLVPELDGDDSYQLAALDAAELTAKPIALISNLACAIDQAAAATLRGSGIPVLEGMRTGMLALRHLLDHQGRTQPTKPGGPGDAASRAGNDAVIGPAAGPASPGAIGRLARARELLAQGERTGAAQLALLREYGIPAVRAEQVATADEAVAAAARIGYPVVLKTDRPGIAHKSDAGGVILRITSDEQLVAAYAELTARLGPAALVCETASPGTELALGVVRDPALGPMIVVGAGGVLVELIADRAVALPPVSQEQAAALLGELKVRALLAGARGGKPADLGAVTRAITGLAELAGELGEDIDALDINPLVCGPHGAVAVDALVIRRTGH
ncbi:MAG TPA: acetate--CoA ligase family protein, partial [Streptosporangiaceae bacterium]